jgi:hypothetical protein
VFDSGAAEPGVEYVHAEVAERILKLCLPSFGETGKITTTATRSCCLTGRPAEYPVRRWRNLSRAAASTTDLSRTIEGSVAIS